MVCVPLTLVSCWLKMWSEMGFKRTAGQVRDESDDEWVAKEESEEDEAEEEEEEKEEEVTGKKGKKRKKRTTRVTKPQVKEQVKEKKGKQKGNDSRKAGPSRIRAKVKEEADGVGVEAKLETGVKPLGRKTLNALNTILGQPLAGNQWGPNRQQRELASKLVIPHLVPVPCSLSQNSSRITSLAWHPFEGILLLGAKHGEVYSIRDLEYSPDGSVPAGPNTKYNEVLSDGAGPGNSITTIKFDELDPEYYYTSSISGHVMRRNLRGQSNATLFDAGTICNLNACGHPNQWFTALDINTDRKLVLAGDNKGNLHLIPRNDHGSHKALKLHKDKINYLDLHPLDSNLLASSSGDRTVKVWDMRMLSGDKSLISLPHKSPVNSGCFSLTNGGTFATTDQRDEINIFCTTNWSHERVINHPHRFFHYLTPVKGMWHPRADVLVVGRYPDDTFLADDKRTIDFYDASSGKLVGQLRDNDYTGIMCLNAFNRTGDTLASSMGSSMVLWKRSSFLESIYETKLKQQKGKSSGESLYPYSSANKKPKRPQRAAKMCKKMMS